MEVDAGGGRPDGGGGVTPGVPHSHSDPMLSETEGKENRDNTISDQDSGAMDEKMEKNEEDDSNVNDSLNGKGKRRNRRRNKGGKHHRKWKPYDKLTWDERKSLEDKETKRATKKRESRFASGQAMAPYNTTQFLMEQHEPSEGDIHMENHNHGHPRCDPPHETSSGNMSPSGGSGEGSSDEDSYEEEIFLEKDFTEAYEQYHAERLQNMSKEDLVKEHIELEEEVESLKKQLKSMEEENRRHSSGSSRGSHTDISQDDVTTIQAIELLRQVKRLKEENEKLKGEKGARVTKSDPPQSGDNAVDPAKKTASNPPKVEDIGSDPPQSDSK